MVVFVAIFWREDYRGARNAVTHDCRSNTSFGPLALFLLAGLTAAVPIGLLLYRKAPAKNRRVALAVCTASLAGYVAAFGFSVVLIMTRG